MKKSSLVKYFKYFHHYFIVLYDLAHNNSKLHTANISTYYAGSDSDGVSKVQPEMVLYTFQVLSNEKNYPKGGFPLL